MESCNQSAYKLCMKNHAAAMGMYATDGCAQFRAEDDGGSNPQCSACGCHRSFHCKDPPNIIFMQQTVQVLPMPLAVQIPMTATRNQEMPPKRRRARTKFSPQQTERMWSFAENLRWRMCNSRRDGGMMNRFLQEIGVSRRRFMIWMNNHRGEASRVGSSTAAAIAAVSSGTTDSDSDGVGDGAEGMNWGGEE